MFNKTKNKNKQYFCKYCLQCFSSERIFVEHKEICLNINGQQTVNLKLSFIEFKNYSRQILAPFKIYADFECILKNVNSNKKTSGSYTEKYQDNIPCNFAYKLVYADHKFIKPVVLYRVEYAAYNFIKMMLEEFGYCKKVMKKHFKKNLILTEEEENFRSSNICWIYEKLIDDEKVRDHCHITGNYRGTAHWSCNVNLKLIKKVFIIYRNLKGCDGHLTMNVIDKFDVNVSVILNGLEKYMAFTISKNLVFIGSKEFMNSS